MKRTRTLVGGLVTVALALCAQPALASTASAPAAVAPLSSCPSLTFTQPFAPIGDFNYYTLAPGGTFGDPIGGGWQFTGGASIVQTTQHDSTVGGVLDLPSKSRAVSPVMCISPDYPKARLWVRNVVGSEGVFFNVVYLNADGTWAAPKDNGQFHGTGKYWTLSGQMNVSPGNARQARFVFLAGGNTSRFQVDDFWVDPRIRF